MGRTCVEVESPEIDLNLLTGNVINTQKVMLQPFESRVISRTMKGSIRTVGISKRVNVLTEPMETQINEDSCFSAVPAYTYVTVFSLLEMHSGGNVRQSQCHPFSPGVLGASDLILIYYWGGLCSAAPTGGGPCSAVLQHLRVANALVRM